MELAHTELDLRERRAIEDMLHAKVPANEIAAAIGRQRSTVYRGVKRNYFHDEELARHLPSRRKKQQPHFAKSP